MFQVLTEQELILRDPLDPNNQIPQTVCSARGPLRASDLPQDWDCHTDWLLVSSTHTISGSHSLDSLLATHLGSSGPFALMTHSGPVPIALTSGLSWTQSDSFWYQAEELPGKDILALGPSPVHPSSLKVGTRWAALSSLAGPPTPRKSKDQDGFIQIREKSLSLLPLHVFLLDGEGT